MQTVTIQKEATISNQARFPRIALWLAVGALAAWFGNGTTQAWRTRLTPSGAVESGLVELFGAQLQWAVLIAMVPVVFWATGKRVAAGLAISVGFLAAGHSVAGLTFLLVLAGVGLFLELDDDRWQSQATSAAAAMLAFALVSPWAALIGGGVLLLLSAIKKSVALPTLVVFFPSVIAAVLMVVFFVDGLPSLVDAIAAVGIICLSAPVLAVGVGVAALLLSFGAVHSTAVLAGSVGVFVVDAPTEIAPELISEGFAVQEGARFALVNDLGVDEVEVGRADGWILVDRTR